MTFMVQDSRCNNSDGTNNSIYGTSPDYYVPYTFESIAKRNQLPNDRIMVNEYQNRLKWDSVLAETINMIQKNE